MRLMFLDFMRIKTILLIWLVVFSVLSLFFLLPQYSDFTRSAVFHILDRKIEVVRESVLLNFETNRGKMLKRLSEYEREGFMEEPKVDFLYVSDEGDIFVVNLKYKVFLIYNPVIRENVVVGWVKIIVDSR